MTTKTKSRKETIDAEFNVISGIFLDDDDSQQIISSSSDDDVVSQQVLTLASSADNNKKVDISGGALTSAFLEVLYQYHHTNNNNSNDHQDDKSWGTVLRSMRSKLQKHQIHVPQQMKMIPQLTSSRMMDVQTKTMAIVPPTTSTLSSTVTTTKRAVLIGIHYDSMQDKKEEGETEGGEGGYNDVMEMKRYLMSVEGFFEQDILLLCNGSDGSKSNKSKKHTNTKNGPNSDSSILIKPTKKNIEKAFRKMAKYSQKGDTVFIHYSGYGRGSSQLLVQKSSTKNNDNNEDNNDDQTTATIVVPVDYPSSGTMTDNDIQELMITPMKPGVTVTVLLDYRDNTNRQQSLAGTNSTSPTTTKLFALPYQYSSNSSSSSSSLNNNNSSSNMEDMIKNMKNAQRNTDINWYLHKSHCQQKKKLLREAYDGIKDYNKNNKNINSDNDDDDDSNNVDLDIDDNEVIEINVGGEKVVSVLYKTLTQIEGSKLAQLFRVYKHKLVRDHNERIYLDINSTCFDAIIEYLREHKMSMDIALTKTKAAATATAKIQKENQNLHSHTTTTENHGVQNSNNNNDDDSNKQLQLLLQNDHIHIQYYNPPDPPEIDKENELMLDSLLQLFGLKEHIMSLQELTNQGRNSNNNNEEEKKEENDDSSDKNNNSNNNKEQLLLKKKYGHHSSMDSLIMTSFSSRPRRQFVDDENVQQQQPQTRQCLEHKLYEFLDDEIMEDEHYEYYYEDNDDNKGSDSGYYYSTMEKYGKGKLELLYRASVDGWSGADFHGKGDNHDNNNDHHKTILGTITLVKTSRGYVFGGFTDTPWTSGDNKKTIVASNKNKNSYKDRTKMGYKKSNNSFLFAFNSYAMGRKSIKMKNRYQLSSSSSLSLSSSPYVVYQYALSGPAFGCGLDLYISSNANSNHASFTSLGHTFQLPSLGHTFQLPFPLLRKQQQEEEQKMFQKKMLEKGATNNDKNAKEEEQKRKKQKIKYNNNEETKITKTKKHQQNYDGNKFLTGSFYFRAEEIEVFNVVTTNIHNRRKKKKENVEKGQEKNIDTIATTNDNDQLSWQIVTFEEFKRTNDESLKLALEKEQKVLFELYKQKEKSNWLNYFIVDDDTNKQQQKSILAPKKAKETDAIYPGVYEFLGYHSCPRRSSSTCSSDDESDDEEEEEKDVNQNGDVMNPGVSESLGFIDSSKDIVESDEKEEVEEYVEQKSPGFVIADAAIYPSVFKFLSYKSSIVESNIASKKISDLVHINADGMHFLVQRSTLVQFKNSVFAKQFIVVDNKDEDKSLGVNGKEEEQQKTRSDLVNDISEILLSPSSPASPPSLYNNNNNGDDSNSKSLRQLSMKLDAYERKSILNNTVYIENDGYCFSKIIDQLRLRSMMNMELSSSSFFSIPAPYIQKSKREKYRRLADYYFLPS